MRVQLVCSLLIALNTVSWCSVAGADAESPPTVSAPKAKGPSLLEKYNQVVRDAFRAANQTVKSREPRKIAKGSLPEIVLRRDKIFFNGNLLRLGTSLQEWFSVLPPLPRCTQFSPSLKSCDWDDLGITVTLNAMTEKVNRLDIQFQKPIISNAEKIAAQQDKLAGKVPLLSSEPARTFTGYLELDGYAIDSGTMFWEIEKSIDQSRNLHCGLRDCQFRGAIFGKGSKIYIELNGPDATDTLSLIQIGLE